MNKKKILILLILFVTVAGMTLAPASAGSKTINIQNKDWKNDWNYGESTNGGKFVLKKSGNFEVGIGIEYQNSNKRWATKNMPKTYFEDLKLSAESKKKFKSATFYLYDDKTGEYKKKITLKPKYKNLYRNGYIGKGYCAEKIYYWNHRYTCKKVVINY